MALYIYIYVCCFSCRSLAQLGLRQLGLPDPPKYVMIVVGGLVRPGKCYPKDPAVLKTVRDSELLRRSVFTTPPRFTTP